MGTKRLTFILFILAFLLFPLVQLVLTPVFILKVLDGWALVFLAVWCKEGLSVKDPRLAWISFAKRGRSSASDAAKALRSMGPVTRAFVACLVIVGLPTSAYRLIFDTVAALMASIVPLVLVAVAVGLGIAISFRYLNVEPWRRPHAPLEPGSERFPTPFEEQVGGRRS